MKLSELLKATKGQALSTLETEFSGVNCDSRENLKGQIFFALQGENTDGHKYLNEVCNKASAVVVSSVENISDVSLCTVIQVSDTLLALQNWAHRWRQINDFEVIAITGSNGKTTTKNFLSQILPEEWSFVSSPKSFNNHIGVPLTLLKGTQKDQIILTEIGISREDEMQTLCGISQPNTVGVLTVGRAHSGYFGSLEKLAQAKSEIYESSSAEVGIFNLDNPWTQIMFEKHKMKKFFTFSMDNKKASVQMTISKLGFHFLEISGRILNVESQVQVFVFGKHQLYNLMAASAFALSLGMKPQDIWERLRNCKTSWGRTQLISSKKCQILFDAYNSNPESVYSLLESIMACEEVFQKKFLVFGEMLELESLSSEFHEELGQWIGSQNWERVWFIGGNKEDERALKGFKKGYEKNKKKSKNLAILNSYETTLAKEIASVVSNNDLLVLKGSRGVHLERILEDKNFSES